MQFSRCTQVTGFHSKIIILFCYYFPHGYNIWFCFWPLVSTEVPFHEILFHSPENSLASGNGQSSPLLMWSQKNFHQVYHFDLSRFSSIILLTSHTVLKDLLQCLTIISHSYYCKYLHTHSILTSMLISCVRYLQIHGTAPVPAQPWNFTDDLPPIQVIIHSHLASASTNLSKDLLKLSENSYSLYQPGYL